MNNKRIINFDFLRGIFIYFALLEHYAYYVNVWYPFYYEKDNYSAQIQKVNNSLINTYLPIDQICVILISVFVIWVSHVYLTMASFNLAKRKASELKDILKSKITTNATLYMAFSIESFVVANNFGEAITLHPILLWMLCLSALAIVYAFFDLIGVFLLSLVSIYFYYLMNHYHIAEAFQSYIQNHLHNAFYYDARLESFMISSLVGFGIGYVHYHSKNVHKYLYMIGLGIALFVLGKMLGAQNMFAPDLNMDKMFNSEVVAYTKYENMIYLQGIQIFVLSFFLYLEDKGIIINNKIINWIGVNSLLIFILHKVLIIKLWLPLRMVIGSFFDSPLKNNTFELSIFVFLTFGIAWIIKKTKILEKLSS